MVDKSYIATPHIAGYSAKAKKNASLKIYSEFCKWFSLDCEELEDRDIELKCLTIEEGSSNILGAMSHVLPLMRVSAQFKKLTRARIDRENAVIFDRLRAGLKGRHEFCEYAIPKYFSDEDTYFLKAAGFNPR